MSWVWRAVQQKTGRVALFAVGVAVLGLAYVQPKGQDPLAAFTFGSGSLMIVLACLIPWVREARVSPQGGLSVTMRDDPAAVASAEVAEVGASAAGDEFDLVDDNSREGAIRYMLAEESLSRLLRPRRRPLAKCEFRLFLFDSIRDRLLPVFDPDDRPSEGWARGQGVTGEAYARGEYVIAVGSEASDASYRLTPQQQERYRDLAMVAAMPVFNARGTVLAVLSGTTKDPSSELGSPAGFDAHLVLAEKVARILVDLLGWFDDEE